MEAVTSKDTNNMPRLAPNSGLARLFLAFLTTAGLFYVNIMPALIEGLVDGLGFSNRDAGLVGSANVYGAAFGAFVVVFLIPFINWRTSAYGLLMSLVALDFASVFLVDTWPLIGMRFLHGTLGGMLVGLGFAVIARTESPDKTFGYLLTVQFGLGGLGLLYLPGLVPVYGTSVLFGALIIFSVVTALMLPFLDEYQVSSEQPTVIPWKKMNKYFLLACLATFLFQAANMGLYAYIIGMGREAGLAMDYISRVLAEAAWIAIAGSVLVIFISTKYGRLLPITLGVVLTAAGSYLLHFIGEPYIYWVANVLVGITWAFVISYLLGLCSEFDSTGQLAAIGGLASKLGLASGPLIAALIVDTKGYDWMIDLAVVSLVVCGIVAIWPTRKLDRK